MRISNCVLVSLAAAGCMVAQNPAPKLDFTFPQFRPQTPQNGVSDFSRRLDRELFRPQRRSTPQRLTRPTVNLLPPNRQIRLLKVVPSPCAIPLLEAKIPKDTHFMVRQLRPRKDQLAPMPKVNGPAPSCADKE